MERLALFTHLALAERHVAEGEAALARQRRLVAELERDGHDTRTASELLRTFESTQASHLEELDRIRAEVAEAGDAAGPC